VACQVGVPGAGISKSDDIRIFDSRGCKVTLPYILFPCTSQYLSGSGSMVINLNRSLGMVANTGGQLTTYYAAITAGHKAKQGGLNLLNLFGDYLKDFHFPALQQFAERTQAEPIKEGY
jgi:hypothetical protein